MTKVTIEDREYEMDEISDAAQTQVANITYCDGRIHELRREMAVLRTARASYVAALREALPKEH